MSRPTNLTQYLNMIKKEVIRNSYVDLYDSWGFEEDEIQDCEKYIADKLGEDFMFARYTK